MFRIALQLADKSEWVKIFDPRDATVFVITNEPPDVGEKARIDLIVGVGGPRIILRGKVIARRVKGDTSLPRGCSVALDPYEREKVNYLNGFVRGGLLDLREKRRLPLRLSVTYGDIKGPVKSHTRDINDEGIFIVSNSPLPEESEVHMHLAIPGRDQPMTLAGIVTHTVVVEDEDIPGMGIKFNLTPEQSTELSAIIDELERAFLDGSLPEEMLL